MAKPCAVIGIGQTKYKSKRIDVSLEGRILMGGALERAWVLARSRDGAPVPVDVECPPAP